MAEKKSGLGLTETRGTFELKGVVTGVQKDGFYKQTMTKTDKPFRMVNFGVTYAKDKTVYVTLSGMEQDKVFFSPISKKDDKEKKETLRIDWADRFTYNKEGYRLIGVNVGVQKTKDEKGNEANDKKTLTAYDACKEVGDNLVDGVSVYVRGNITYSTYNERHMVRFEPNQISLCQPVNFEEEKEIANFTQTIVFMSISPSEDKSKFIVSAKNVTYNSIEDAEYIIKNPVLANTFRKALKPYTSIRTWGDIGVEVNTEEIVEETNEWGESNPMDKLNTPIVRELIITGADGTSVDHSVYSQAAFDEAVTKLNATKAAKSDYGSGSEDWGTANLNKKDDDDDDPWA